MGQINHNAISVWWLCDKPKITLYDIKQIQTSAIRLGLLKVIIILNEGTQLAKNYEKEILIKVELCGLEDLQVNITDHFMVPKHSVLNEDEKQELLDKYKIKSH